MSNTPAAPCVFLDFTLTKVNGADAVGVTTTVDDGALVPRALVAVIVNVNATSLASPVTKIGEEEPLATTAPMLSTTLKLVIGALLSEKAVKLTMALALPGAALGEVGALGTVVLDVLNVAVTLLAASIVMLHAPVPVHAPNQPAKALPKSGLVVSVTTVALAKSAPHVPPHVIPAGDDVTVPVPVPPLFTVRVFGPSVIDVNTALSPPIVNVVFVDPLGNVDDVCRTHIVCPLLIVPGTFVKAAVQPTEYPLPVPSMETGTAESMPVIVTTLEACRVLSTTSKRAGKMKSAGIVFFAGRLTA